MKTLLLLPILLLLACSIEPKSQLHPGAPGNDTIITISSTDSIERLEYVIADTMLDGHHIRIERYTCSIRVMRDGRQELVDWPEYNECDFKGNQGLLTVEHGKVRPTGVVAIGSNHLYFGCMQPTCRPFNDLFHCIVLPDGSLSCAIENSYSLWIIVDPIRQLYLTKEYLSHEQYDSSGVYHSFTHVAVFPLGQDRNSAPVPLKKFRINESDSLFYAGFQEVPSDSLVLTFYRRFMR